MENENSIKIRELRADLEQLRKSLIHYGKAAEYSAQAEEHQAEADKLGEEANLAQKLLGDHLKEISSVTTGYLQIVALVGYAGLFSVWNFMRAELPVDHQKWIAFLALLSVALFVVWEIISALFRLFDIRLLSSVLEKGLRAEEVLSRVAIIKEKSQQRQVYIVTGWIWAFLVSSISATAAGGILVYDLATSIWGN